MKVNKVDGLPNSQPLVEGGNEMEKRDILNRRRACRKQREDGLQSSL
jgi:hypothetical protein